MIVDKLTDKELNEVQDSAMLLNGWSPELTWAVENNDLANDNLNMLDSNGQTAGNCLVI